MTGCVTVKQGVSESSARGSLNCDYTYCVAESIGCIHRRQLQRCGTCVALRLRDLVVDNEQLIRGKRNNIEAGFSNDFVLGRVLWDP